MNKSQHLFDVMKKYRLIAMLTPTAVGQCVKAYEILRPYGIVLEIAFRSDAAQEGIRAVLKKHPDALILAGTVMTPEQAEAAIQAGAVGIVSADYIPGVIDVCVKHDVMCIPGGLSDAGKQLVRKAEGYGCDLDTLREKHPYQWIYKLFPAVVGARSNAEIAAAWRGPYKGLTVVYTGGVSIDNLRELVLRDPDGIFCGSALTRSVDDPEAMNKEVEEWVSIVAGRREKRETVRQSGKKKKEERKKVATFGEIMLRLSPPDHRRFVQAGTYDATFGGAEANVAAALANYGLDSCFITALPDHEIGQAAIHILRAFGVDTRHILRQGKRIGIYFLEHGASQRPSKVIYDREGSSISEIRTGQIDWEAVFRDAAWFHWSGITPALSDSAAEVMEEALRAAKKIGLTVSVDLNYRKKLWSREKAQSVMTSLMPMVDICIGNEEDAESMFGIRAGDTDVESGQLDIRRYEEVARKMVKQFGFNKAALTLRESLSASENGWSACLYNGKEFLRSKKYIIHIVDRVGGGDSFSSGLIYALMTGKSDRDALEFGAAASCLKQTIPGDFNLVSVQEVERLVEGKGSGRVQR